MTFPPATEGRAQPAGPYHEGRTLVALDTPLLKDARLRSALCMANQTNQDVPITERNIGLLIGRPVQIQYQDKDGRLTTRTVTPKAITFYNGHRAIRAHCHLRNDERTFLLSRIRQCSCANLVGIVQDRRAEEKQQVLKRLATARKHFVGLLLTAVLGLSGSIFAIRNITPASVSVSAYTRNDGTHVSTHNRRPPGAKKRDRPYELLRNISLLALAGGAIGTWLVSRHSSSLRAQASQLDGP